MSISLLNMTLHMSFSAMWGRLGCKKSWDKLSKTWNLKSSPRRTLWEQCGQDFVCRPTSAALKLLPPKAAPVDFASSQDKPDSPSLRGPPLLEFPADDLID